MSDRKWTSFDVEMPSEDISQIWVADPSESVWAEIKPLYGWKHIKNSLKNFYWAYMTKPEPPSAKEVHSVCFEYNKDVRCSEKDGSLIVWNGQDKDVCIKVRFCPFCGYEAKR